MNAPDVVGWNGRLLDQLTFYWTVQLRPRLDGLTDNEYFWEPVPNCWSVRRREAATTSVGKGVGPFVVEVERPPPDPPPVTTIAWRLVHIIVDCFGTRSENHLGGPPINWQQYEVPGTADWRYGTSTTPSRPGPQVSRYWALRASSGRAARPKAHSPTTRSQASFCTSIAR